METKEMEKIVVFFDICSSSRIIEDLLLSQESEIENWYNLLSEIESTLEANRDGLQFSIYKFLGDGWILIFDKNTNVAKMFDFFKSLCIQYRRCFDSNIADLLNNRVEICGLAFGMDIGGLYKINIGGNEEFISPSLNVAARLQGAIKTPNDNKDIPANQILLKRRIYNRYVKPVLGDRYRAKSVERTLRNIRNNAVFYCTRIWLLEEANA